MHDFLYNILTALFINFLLENLYTTKMKGFDDQ